jgi:hypothetical protein
MTYKPYSAEDRGALFTFVLDLDMSEHKKGKCLMQLYEEYRITHDQYRDVHEFVATTNSKDLQYTCSSSKLDL